jgi:hypothetical protein
MFPWVLAVGAGIASVAAWALTRKPAPTAQSPSTVAPGATALNTGTKAKSNLVPSLAPSDPFANAVTVHTPDGVAWLVSPDYVGPVSAGQAEAMAKAAGGELPSPALVDAIWRQADLKILPPVRAQNIASAAVFADQKARIQNLIGDKPFTLLGGTYKDIVQLGGKPQLYGWHVEDGKSVAGVLLHSPFTPGPGKIIQGPSGGAHNTSFIDYSQGVRLVRRA